jgi:hypothetical protein
MVINRLREGVAMVNVQGLLLGVALASLPAMLLGSGPATAGGLCTSLVLSCEDGRTYPLCPIAVSDAGEIVTGNFVVAPRRGIHVRLVPMGVGYRYIGRGVWFDGVRSEAILYLGKHRSLTCTVVRE